MTNQQVIPNYLPSITDWLDHVAGIPTTGVAKAKPELPLSSNTGAQTASARPRAGSLFRFNKQRYEEMVQSGFYFEL